MRELLREAAGGDDSLQALDDDPLPDEEFDWAGIPDDVRDKVGEVLAAHRRLLRPVARRRVPNGVPPPTRPRRGR